MAADTDVEPHPLAEHAVDELLALVASDADGDDDDEDSYFEEEPVSDGEADPQACVGDTSAVGGAADSDGGEDDPAGQADVQAMYASMQQYLLSPTRDAPALPATAVDPVPNQAIASPSTNAFTLVPSPALNATASAVTPRRIAAMARGRELSAFARMEEVRLALERELGEDAFVQAYRIVRQAEAEDMAVAQGQLEALLGVARASRVYPTLVHLVVSESTHFEMPINVRTMHVWNALPCVCICGCMCVYVRVCVGRGRDSMRERAWGTLTPACSSFTGCRHCADSRKVASVPIRVPLMRRWTGARRVCLVCVTEREKEREPLCSCVCG